MCLRSWNRSSSTPVARAARRHAVYSDARRNGCPCVPGNTSASRPLSHHVSRCTSSSGIRAGGMATVRLPASLFGGPMRSVPSASSCICSTTCTDLCSRSRRLRVRARSSPRRRPVNVAVSTRARERGSIAPVTSDQAVLERRFHDRAEEPVALRHGRLARLRGPSADPSARCAPGHCGTNVARRRVRAEKETRLQGPLTCAFAGAGDENRTRVLAWEADVLPLNYTRGHSAMASSRPVIAMTPRCPLRDRASEHLGSETLSAVMNRHRPVGARVSDPCHFCPVRVQCDTQPGGGRGSYPGGTKPGGTKNETSRRRGTTVRGGAARLRPSRGRRIHP